MTIQIIGFICTTAHELEYCTSILYLYYLFLFLHVILFNPNLCSIARMLCSMIWQSLPQIMCTKHRPLLSFLYETWMTCHPFSTKVVIPQPSERNMFQTDLFYRYYFPWIPFFCFNYSFYITFSILKNYRSIKVSKSLFYKLM